MIGDRIMLQRVTRAAWALMAVSVLLGLCTAGTTLPAPREVLEAGKEVGHLTAHEYLGVSVVVLSIALVSLVWFILQTLISGTLAKVAKELAVLSAERERHTKATEYCERHSGKRAADERAEELRR